ncbi:MAG: tetratricopeptide repeat protein [Saprospiraceae bacterium]
MSNFLNTLIYQTFWNRLIIICLTLTIYANTLNNDFVLDDNIVLKKNEYVKKGPAGLGEIFMHDSFKGFFLNDQSGVSVTGGRYRPLSLMFFASVYPIFGLNAIYYHLINILFYILLCLVIYQFLLQLFSIKFGEEGKMLAFFTTILYAAHPIHTEVVSNIKGIDEIFSLLFSILSSLFVFKYLDFKKLSSLFYAFLFFLLGIFSKESAINFLVLVPFAIYLFRNVRFKDSIIAISPIVISTLLYVSIRIYVIGFKVFDELTRDVLTNPFLKIRGINVTDASTVEKLGMIFYSLGKYLQLMIFPHPLTHDYFPLHVSLQPLQSPQPLFSLIIFIGLFIVAIVYRNSKPQLSFGLMSLIVPLILISNLVIPMGTPMGERFAFTASLGFCLVFAYFLMLLNNKSNKLSLALLSFVLVLFSFKVYTRNKDWKDEYSLFSKDVQISKNSIKAHSELAYHLVERIKVTKDTLISNALIAEAIPHLQKTVQLYPRHANALYLLGNLNYLKKDYEKAAESYDKYLELVPTGKEVMRNLQVCYREYGRDLAMNNKELDKAVEVLIRAFKLNPNDARLLESLGIAYGAKEEYALSIEYFNKAIKMEPKNGLLLVNLGNTYYKMGEKNRGSEYIKAAYRLDTALGPKLLTLERPKI